MFFPALLWFTFAILCWLPQCHSLSPKLLQDSVCLVTGASRGIGKGVAIELGSQGATVYVTGTSTSSTEQERCNGQYVTCNETGGPGTIEDTASEVTEAGGIGIPIYCNHADDESVQKVIDEIQDRHSRLDILVSMR